MACSTHLQAAFDQYSSYLEQLRCICRSVIDRGASSPNVCCGANKSKSAAHKKKKRSGHKHKGRQGKKTDAVMPTFKPSGNTAKAGHEKTDPENNSGVETVNFLVSGMDCTSCADKLMRTFGTMTGVSQPRVNFVMGNGEFNVDTSTTNADEVISFAATASGFTLTKVVGGDFFLDILIPAADAKQLAANPPQGVTDVQTLDKKTTRLAYDPAIVGARDLYGQVGDQCRGLAPPRADPQLENSRQRLLDQLTKTGLAAAFTIPVCVVTYGDYLASKKAGAIVAMVLGTMVQMVAIPEFYRPAITALWYSRTVEMDMLVVMSITAAYVYSIIAFGFEMADKPLEQEAFFETSSLLITLILVGRLVAAFARVQAVASVSLRSQQNTQALLVTEEGDREIDARLLQYGDRFKILPHTRVPTDGLVLTGTTEVDESMLTGESMPVLKNKGDNLIAGTVNGNSTVVALLVRLPGKNTVTDIAQLVEDAANSKPRLQDLANKVASWFVPTMATIAVLAFAIWLATGMEVRNWNAGKSVGNAITYAVATLAVACPCALGLAVPMVLVVAGGIAARGGIIIKSAETTERARKTTDVVFDKTGTITEGELAVIKQVRLQGSGDEAIALTKALVAEGKHPVSAAIEKYLEYAAQSDPEVSNVRVVPGAGIEADYKGGSLKAGHARWTNTETNPEVVRLQKAGLTTLVVTHDTIPLVIFGLRTQIRAEAVRVIAELKARKISVHLVSGDQAIAVNAVAATAGIPLENAVGERTPPEKRDYVAALMEDNAKHVMFIGDGTNDAVAVAQANVGVQMRGGLTSSDITQNAADVVLLNDLDGVLFLLNVSRAAFHRMAFNFVWSAFYNVIAITMASGAWIKVRIPPAYAGIGEIVSVIPVILAAMSMLLLNLK